MAVLFCLAFCFSVCIIIPLVEDTTSQLPNYVNFDVKVSLENYMSAKVYSGTYLSLCDYITPLTITTTTTTDTDIDFDEETSGGDGDASSSSSSSYKCPHAGSYTFELSYTIPSDSSTLWWSSGKELHIELALKSMVSTSTTCEIVIYPSSMSASSYVVWGSAGLLFVIIAGCIAGRERLIRTCSYECTPQPGIDGNDPTTRYNPNPYYISDDVIQQDYYHRSPPPEGSTRNFVEMT